MAKEEDLVLGDPEDEQPEYIDVVEEARLNIGVAIDVFRFLDEFDKDSTWVIQNNFVRRVNATKIRCMETIVRGMREICPDREEPTKTESPPS